MTSEVKAVYCTTVEIPMSFTPKKIEFMMMNDSAAELVTASKVTFIVSAENYKRC